jgi:NADPH2:quinone reductase
VSTFNAFRIFDKNEKIEGRVVQASLDELTPGEVVIRAAYSSVNYKDALAGTGTGKIVRRYPLVGGIDVSGSVASSTDPRFQTGDEVLVTGYDLGVTQDGGYAEYTRVPADWVVPIPADMTPFEAMAFGTAGFTAALSIIEMERNGLAPGSGPVIVTGSTGGVGSIGVELLAALGYEVTALTGKDDAHDYLRSLGAREVLSRKTLDMGTRPLEKAVWAGALDVTGGAILSWITRTMRRGGCIASSGLTAGVELETTVMPFILRGVKLLGIDSATCPMAQRLEVWARLATDMKSAHTNAIVREIALADLPDAFATLLRGDARGRFVVKI